MESNNKKDVFPDKKVNNYMKYSSLGFQMIGAIIFTGWLGNFIDNKMDNKTPVWTLVLMLLGVTTSIFLLIRSVTKE